MKELTSRIFQSRPNREDRKNTVPISNHWVWVPNTPSLPSSSGNPRTMPTLPIEGARVTLKEKRDFLFFFSSSGQLCFAVSLLAAAALFRSWCGCVVRTCGGFLSSHVSRGHSDLIGSAQALWPPPESSAPSVLTLNAPGLASSAAPRLPLRTRLWAGRPHPAGWLISFLSAECGPASAQKPPQPSLPTRSCSHAFPNKAQG